MHHRNRVWNVVDLFISHVHNKKTLSINPRCTLRMSMNRALLFYKFPAAVLFSFLFIFDFKSATTGQRHSMVLQREMANRALWRNVMLKALFWINKRKISSHSIKLLCPMWSHHRWLGVQAVMMWHFQNLLAWLNWTQDISAVAENVLTVGECTNLQHIDISANTTIHKCIKSVA